MSIVLNLMYLYLLLKPYYIFESGTIQISDIFLILSFVVLILVSKSNKKKFVEMICKNRYFFFFLITSTVVNFIYFIIYYKFKFLLSSSYILFNFIAIIILSYAFDNKEFFVKINKIFKFNIVVQFIINLLHIGRMFGSLRYMGTFNDPNQFSYYILITLTFIYVLDKLNSNVKNEWLYTIISIYLIICSASTGMILGLVLLMFVKLLISCKNNKLLKCFIIMSMSIIIIIFSLGESSIDNYLSKYNDNFIISRITDKTNRINGNKKGPSLLEERGYDKIIKNPQYIIYGAGEGEYYRFNGYGDYEIHATFPSLLFYYGIVPFSFLIIWIYKKIKNVKMIYLLFLLPLMVESFTLLNQRQTLFWGIILLYEYIKIDGDKNEIYKNNI